MKNLSCITKKERETEKEREREGGSAKEEKGWINFGDLFSFQKNWISRF